MGITDDVAADYRILAIEQDALQGALKVQSGGDRKFYILLVYEHGHTMDEALRAATRILSPKARAEYLEILQQGGSADKAFEAATASGGA